MSNYNFSAGPATLPASVVEQIKNDLPEWQGQHCSVMEVSHRSKAFGDMLAQAEADLRELMDIPNNYHVLFMQGGASLQFSAIPMNLLGDNKQADYIVTGHWSKRAVAEAERYAKVNIVTDALTAAPYKIAKMSEWQLNDKAAYCHYTGNATIYGLEFPYVPQVDVPLVADLSSDILSKPIDVSQFGLIYAGAQKNLGIAGVTIVIIRDDLIKDAMPMTPTLMRYQTQVEKKSLYNTPCSFACYVFSLMMKWMKQEGGADVLGERNQRKADKIYQAIDGSDFYANDIVPEYRSRMTPVFTLPSDELTQQFIQAAAKCGLYNLKGHRSVGGVRASIYNAMDESGVDALVEFMSEFAGAQ